MQHWHEHIAWKRISLWTLFAALVGYFAHEPGWKSGSALVAAFFAVVAIEYAEFRQKLIEHGPRTQVREHDKALFQQLMALLPSNGVIAFVNQHNMSFGFDEGRIEPIDRFVLEWQNAQHEFIDVDVEHAKAELMQACRAWCHTINIETFRMSDRRQSVPPEWETDQPERFEKVIRQLHDEAQAIVDKHEHLVRVGTRRLMS